MRAIFQPRTEQDNGGFMADTHTVMPKKLAQALMEAGMQHFDVGGMVNQQRSGGIGGAISGIMGSNNDFQAAGADNIGQINQQYGQQQDVYGQQQALASQLLAQTQGQGPGQNLIAQQGANLGAQQAAMMAGARGASSNPALIARNAALAGQQGQQQVLNAQSNMQLQAQNALAQQQAQMANQSLQGQSIAQGAIAAQNNVNAGVAGQNASTNGGIMGGILGAAGSILGGLFHEGGEVKKMAVGGQVNDNIGIAQFGGQGIPQYGAPQGGGGGAGLGGFLGKALSSFAGGSGTQSMANAQAGYDQADSMLGASQFGANAGQAGIAGVNQETQLPATGAVMPGGQYGAMPAGVDPFAGVGPQYQVGQMNPDFAAHGGRIPFHQMLAGGNVAGKAQVKGDSEKNDTVPTMLSPGEVVIPRSIAQSADAPAKAAEFMKHLKSTKKRGYAGIAEARRNRVS